MSVIEAMARALCIAEHGDHDKSAIELFNGRFDKHVRAALKAAEALGWKLVPVEPTEEMTRCAGEAVTNHQDYDCDELTIEEEDANVAYRAMLAASPSIDGDQAMTDFDKKAREIADDIHAQFNLGKNWSSRETAVIPARIAAALKAAYNDGVEAALKAAYNDGVEAALKEAQPWFKPEAGNHPDIMIRAKKVPT